MGRFQIRYRISIFLTENIGNIDNIGDIGNIGIADVIDDTDNIDPSLPPIPCFSFVTLTQSQSGNRGICYWLQPYFIEEAVAVSPAVYVAVAVYEQGEVKEQNNWTLCVTVCNYHYYWTIQKTEDSGSPWSSKQGWKISLENL